MPGTISLARSDEFSALRSFSRWTSPQAPGSERQQNSLGAGFMHVGIAISAGDPESFGGRKQRRCKHCSSTKIIRHLYEVAQLPAGISFNCMMCENTRTAPWEFFSRTAGFIVFQRARRGHVGIRDRHDWQRGNLKTWYSELSDRERLIGSGKI
jgi:hypothetical protein